MPFRNPTLRQLAADLESKAKWSSEEARIEFDRKMRHAEMGWARHFKRKGKLDMVVTAVQSARAWHKDVMDATWRRK